jgi:hypothetical protein
MSAVESDGRLVGHLHRTAALVDIVDDEWRKARARL